MIQGIYDSRLKGEPVVFSRSAPQFSNPLAGEVAKVEASAFIPKTLFDALITATGSIFEIEKKVIKPLVSKKANKEIYKVIKTFKKTFKEELKLLQERGWHLLCKDLEDAIVQSRSPHQYSYEDIRNSANDLVNKIVYAIAKTFQLYEAKFHAYGTVGPFSDVDYSLSSTLVGQEITTEEALSYQCIRDLVNIRLFRGLSCKLFDTQSYIPHISSYKLEDNIFTIKGKHQFVAFELTLCLLHAKILYRATPEKFINLQNRFNKISDLNLRHSYMTMFAAVNSWIDQLEGEVHRQILRDAGITHTMSTDEVAATVRSIMKKDPGAYKRAQLAFTLPIKMMIAHETEIHERKMRSYQFLLKGHNEYQQISIQRFKSVLEKSTFEFMVRYAMLKALEDEATLSSSEGIVTLEADDSQKHQLDFSKAKQQFHLRSTSMPVIKRAASPIRRLHENTIADELKPDNYQPPTIQTLKIAAFEELFQFDHLISKYLSFCDDRKAQQGAIVSGKYAFRNTHNNLRALHQYRSEVVKRNKNLSDEFIALEERTHNLAKVAKALERCKRKQTLSKDVLLTLLSLKIATKKKSMVKPLKQGRVFRKLDTLFSEYERLGGCIGERYMDIRINKRRRLNHIVEKLSGEGLIETNPSRSRSRLMPKDPEIDRLLRAWTGSNRLKTTNKDLRKTFRLQDRFTLFHYSLQTHADVANFRDEIMQNDFDVMMFLFSEGKMLKPIAIKKDLDFLKIWDNAKSSTR